MGLQNLSLAVAPGERVALLGPSGVGKTSLLRAIAGLEWTLAGRVLVNGRDVTGLKPERRGIVYLHQAPSMFPHLSVLDNVGFPLEVRGATRAQARERAAPLLERVQLASLASRPSTALSGGQRHRVALARALAANPAVLLLDEPFNALDPALRTDVRDAVLDLLSTEGGPGVLVVTHDVDEAAALGHRIVVLMEGRVVQDGAPAEVLARPASLVVAEFLGIPNLVPGECDGRGTFTCALGSYPAGLPRGPAVLVARADALRASGADCHTRGVPATVVDMLHRVGGLHVRLRTGGVELIAVPDPDATFSTGDTVRLSVAVNRVHIAPLHSELAAGV